MSIRLQRLLDRLRRTQRRGPVPELEPREFITLHTLRGLLSEREGVPMSILAHELEVSQPAMTKIVQSLENKGCVTRQIDPSWRRYVLVRLTEHGEQLEREADQCVRTHMQRIFARLGQEDAETLLRICTRLVEIEEEEESMRGEKRSV